MGRGCSPHLADDGYRRDAVDRASEKDRAGNYKHGYGFHPIGCWLAETGEVLAAILRPGNAGSNTAEDHFKVLQLALAQLPTADLDREILVRTDVGGATHTFTADCRDAGIRFSVGYPVDQTLREAIVQVPETQWIQAVDGEGQDRDGAWVTELTSLLDLSAWPEGSRLIVRRERPHPGAQFTIFDAHGYRHTCFLTDQSDESIAALEARHRQRARVEDCIRNGKDTGMRNLPHHAFAHNQTWLELSLVAQDLLCWMRLLCLDGKIALAEPKRLRHRVLHIAGGLCLMAAGPGCVSRPTSPGPPRLPTLSRACEPIRSSADAAPRPAAHNR